MGQLPVMNVVNAKHSKLLLAIAVLALLAGVAASWLLGKTRTQATLPLQSATALLEHARTLPEFHLQDHAGKSFGNDQLTGRWSFLFFGYTHCPDICPTTLATLGEAMKFIQHNEDAEHAQVVFVSVDPQRDSPAQLTQYVRYFHPDFMGVTGARADIDALTRSLGIVYAKTPNPNDPENYLVDHSASILLIGPDARLVALFGAPHQARAIAEDFHQLREHYEG